MPRPESKNYNPVDDLSALNEYLNRYLRGDLLPSYAPQLDAVEPGIVVLEIPNVKPGTRVLVSFEDVED